MRFQTVERMVDYLHAGGVDTNFSDTTKWKKSPEELFQDYQDGEVEFGPCPGRNELAIFSSRVRLLISTPLELLVETERIYPSGEKVVLYDTNPNRPIDLDRLMRIWSLSETMQGTEPIEETLKRMFLQELDMSISDEWLRRSLKPIGQRYLDVTPRFGDHEYFQGVGNAAQPEPPRRSTVYPMWSVVRAHVWEWKIDSQTPGVGHVKNDKDVEIYRVWIPKI